MNRKIIALASFFLVLLVILWITIPGSKQQEDLPTPVSTDEAIEKHVRYLYGIPADSFEVVTGKIRRNQMLGNILYEYGVSERQVYELSLLPKESFDVRRMKAGNKYALFLDSSGVHYFVYEKDLVNYIVVHFDDSIHLESMQKPVIRKTSEIDGQISSSLWETMKQMDVNPILAVEMSEIYQWSIDFFGLQEGDRFKVIYDESFVDSNSVGITRIYAAWFHHAGHEFWAIPFEQGGVISYFDEEGNSLRRTFLKAPLRFPRVSSGFSHSRLHPILKIRRPHHGVDYAAPYGTPVQAVGDGKIIAAAYERGGGNYIKIRHNSVYTTAYLHLSRFAKGIKNGVYVKQGDVIGYVGSTGLSTGPHLDFRFYKNGSALNPLRVKAPPVEPIHEENLVDYELVKRSIMAELESIGN
ncbi:MAG: peptidoglycan DD-metalloendopeptidase family protein [Bacteroidales bacterium]|nr:peptidoglycan DD-metalloendopeptidase family protein [Bacteroidales bacterium]